MGYPAASQCHAPCNSVPATCPCPDGTQLQSAVPPCLVPADVPLPPGSWKEPSRLHRHTSI